MANRRSQIYDVAEKAGVSIATVSRVINEIDKVKPETVAAVKSAMKDLNYFPNEMARALAMNATGMIGFYMTASSLSIFNNKYSLEILRGIESVVLESPYSIVIISEKIDVDMVDFEPKYLKFVQMKRIDGLILNGFDVESSHYRPFGELLEEGFPVAYFGKRTSVKGFNVYAQYENYIYRMFSVFRDKGHKKVFALAMDTPLHGHRFEDVADLFRADHPDGPEIIVCKTSAETDKTGMIARLDSEIRQNGCTGLFVELLSLMPTVLGYLASKNIRVPEDLSIISVEHQKGDGSAFYPKIDCFFVPAFDMGAAAARFLISALESKKIKNDTSIFSPDLIQRESVRVLNG